MSAISGLFIAYCVEYLVRVTTPVPDHQGTPQIAIRQTWIVNLGISVIIVLIDPIKRFIPCSELSSVCESCDCSHGWFPPVMPVEMK
jgi:hypothetical protein